MYDQLHQVKLTDPVTYAGALVNYSFWHIRCRAFLTMYMAINQQILLVVATKRAQTYTI